MSDNDSSALLGRTIAGKFIVEALIAGGGSGTVYRARQLELDRTVALKLLRDDVARDPQFVERFKREARAASRLDHPNSVRVLDFGWHEDTLLYLAMEHVEGRTLHQVIDDEGRLEGGRAVDVLCQVLSAVGVAHDMEVIHRDLKPDNIIIIRTKGDEGDSAELAKVCDFGLATLGTVVLESGGTQMAAPSVTSHGFLMGTPAYMSPEQARGELADRRSDLYSAGAVLYHMLAGRPPFDGDSAPQIAMKHITEEPRPPSAFAPVAPALEAVCLRALSKDPQARFATAREMRAALRASLAPVVAPEAPQRSSRSRRLPWLVGAAALAGVVAVAFAFAVKPARRAPPAMVASIPPVPPPARAPSPPPPPRLPPSPSPLPAAIAIGVPADQSPSPPSPSPPRHRLRSERHSRRAHASASPATREIAPLAGAAPVPPSQEVVSPAPAAAPPAVLPAPAPALARRPLDVEKARVSIVGLTTTSAIPTSSIRAALARSPFVACYRDALRAHGSEATGSATLHLRVDVAGYVAAATLDGAEFLPAMKACVEKAATMARVKDVDTGEASADVKLGFVMAP